MNDPPQTPAWTLGHAVCNPTWVYNKVLHKIQFYYTMNWICCDILNCYDRITKQALMRACRAQIKGVNWSHDSAQHLCVRKCGLVFWLTCFWVVFWCRCRYSKTRSSTLHITSLHTFFCDFFFVQIPQIPWDLTMRESSGLQSIDPEPIATLLQNVVLLHNEVTNVLHFELLFHNAANHS